MKDAPTTFLSKNLRDTALFADSFLKNLIPNKKHATVVCLSGDLGSGKTSFVKELARLFGIKKDEVTSPTFVIEKIYKIKHTFFNHLIHIDAYRLEKEHELETLGWGEIVSDPKNLICIEWPENVKGIIPGDSICLSFEFIDDITRKFTFFPKK